MTSWLGQVGAHHVSQRINRLRLQIVRMIMKGSIVGTVKMSLVRNDVLVGQVGAHHVSQRIKVTVLCLTKLVLLNCH